MRYLILAMLAGCTNQPYVTEPHLDAVVVRVQWLSEAEVRKHCGPQSLACATVGRHNGDMSYLWAVRPASFSDESRVCALGHELLHSLGATHQ